MLATGFAPMVFAGPNKAPSVSLTAPANGATFTALATITLTATASDQDGTVTKVEFFNGTTLLGTSTTAPYSTVWNNVGEGSYTLTAKATDNAGASTTSSAVTITVNPPFNNGPINLTYDELGRLVGLTDGIGSTATYNYDALGNIVSIGRTAVGQVAIIEFTPNNGPVGSTVTISGTGFSTTPNQNTVKFNGTNAVVSTASSTQLVAQVPAGATTGPINVVTPNGSATSSTPFTVSDSNAPAITSIAPTIGPVGTAVTISGSHFQTVPNNNNVEFNTRPAVVTSATASSLATSIGANATSGKVSVATPYGKAVSTQDFYVVPTPYATSDIEVADRIAIGDTKTVTIGSAGKKALILFDAIAGQRVGLQVNSMSFASCVNVQLTRPDGSTVYSGCMGVGSLIDPPPILPYSGTYTLFINPVNNQTGSMTFVLPSVPSDVTGTITVDGPPVTVTTTVAGQNANLTFSGSVGQRVALQSTSSTYTGWVDVFIYKPAADGSASTSNGVIYQACCWGGGNLTDLLTLPVAGIYTIVLNPEGAAIGSMTL
ncbi:Ig-like domain-containing protein, partial [Pseudogulbenkiania subflava]